MSRLEFFGFVRGGRSCSIVAAAAAAETVLAHPDLLPDILTGLDDREGVIRSQFAYALARIAEKQPQILQPHASLILDRLAAPEDSHITRACLLQTAARLQFSTEDADTLRDILRDCMHSASSIVKTFAMQMLWDMAQSDEALRGEAVRLVWEARDHGTPAMRARARKILKKYRI